MRASARYLVTAMAAAIAAVAASSVRADTWTLELKRRESTANPQAFDRTSYMLWTTTPQSFFVQLMPQGKGRPAVRNDQQAKAFARIVKKEPKYACEHPFRGVAKLGSQEYAFALDWVPAKPAAKNEPPEKGKAKPAGKQAKENSAIGKLKDKLTKAKSPEVSTPTAVSYNRLYFDFNHNGDLTDDKVVRAIGSGESKLRNSATYSQFHFPQVDVTIDASGTKLAYSFLLSGYGYAAAEYSYTNVWLNAAVCREGYITLAGKKHHVILLDFNSNGRFDDEIKVSGRIRLPSGVLYPEQGDMLLVDPDPTELDSPYDVTSSTIRHYVSKMIQIDDRFYDVKISPAGDKLTLTPSRVAMGSVTNPSDSFRAVIYGERGFLTIHGTNGAPVPVPEGHWKLLSYTLTQNERPQPAKPAAKQPAKKKEAAKDAAAWQEQAEAVLKLLGGVKVNLQHDLGLGGDAVVSAQATEEYKAVEVKAGKTVALPFGPPYKPKVTSYVAAGSQAFLEMSLVGSAGEVCSNLRVGGRRPSGPLFTITDPKGEVVQEGRFEYG